jgi:hypothetical protein
MRPNKARRQVILAASILILAGLCFFAPIFVVSYIF